MTIIDVTYLILEFSVFLFSLQLMLDQTLSNLIVCLMISEKVHTKNYINELVSVDTR